MGHAMKPVQRVLLEHTQQVAAPGAEVVPLEWGFDGEDYNLAVFVDEWGGCVCWKIACSMLS